MTKRDTYNYVIKDGNKIVYHGITNDPDRRIAEHERSGKEFTHVLVDVYPKTYENARTEEKARNETYKNHSGGQPKYNKRNGG